MKQVARAASIRYSKESDGNSIRSSRTQDYERILANTSAYRRVGYSSPEEQRSNSAARTAAETAHAQAAAASLLQDSSLLVTRDYQSRSTAELDLEEGDLIKIMEKRDGRFWLGRLDGKEGLFPVECCDTSVPLKNNADFVASSVPASSPDTSKKEGTGNKHKSTRPISHETGDGEKLDFLAIAKFRDRHSLSEFSLRDTSSVGLATKDSQGWTLLHHAAQRGDCHVAKSLIDANVPIDVETGDGKTSLFIAANCFADEHTEMVTLLIREGANPLVKGASGASLLHEQVILNHMNNAAALLHEGAYIEARNSQGETPLLLSARLDNAQFAAHLLELGANVNACNFKGESSLFVAACRGHASVIDVLLLSAKADLDLLSETGDSPFHAAAIHGHEQVFRQLSSKKRNSLEVKNMQNGGTPLHSAVCSSQIRFIRAIARDQKLDPQRKRLWNLRDHAGFTPLHYAAVNGLELIGLSLIYGGADVKALDRMGWTALHQAASLGNVAFARMLIEHGGPGILLPSPGTIERALEKTVLALAPVASQCPDFTYLIASIASLVGFLLSFPTSYSLFSLVIAFVSFVAFAFAAGSNPVDKVVANWRVSHGHQLTMIILKVLGAAAFHPFIWALMEDIGHANIAWFFLLITAMSIVLSLFGSVQFVGGWMGVLPPCMEVAITPLDIAESEQQEEMVRYLSQFRTLLDGGVDK